MSIHVGDAQVVLRRMPSASVHCVVTSPPYWGLRDYGVEGQLGMEKTPDEYVAKMVSVFREVRRVLRDDGTCWLNLGDSYARSGGEQGGGSREMLHMEGRQKRMTRVPHNTGLKEKDLVGMPWRVAFALQADGWYLRQDIIWHKPSPMPESVTDRCTKAHEYLFLLTKSPKYYYDWFAVREQAVGKPSGNSARKPRPSSESVARGGQCGHVPWSGQSLRNRRSVWRIPAASFKGAHFATFPPALVEPCILAGTSEQGCCSSCGSPLRRIVAKHRYATRPGYQSKVTGDPAVDGNRDMFRHVTESHTLRWENTCSCEDDRIPCTVLDPFFGAGTTGLVALRLGRRWVGIELSTAYADMAAKRIPPNASGDAS